MTIDDALPPLCDVRGCHQPQFGESLEVTVPGMTLWVRISPCPAHYRMIDQGTALQRVFAPEAKRA
jgi:hypothetical protein